MKKSLSLIAILGLLLSIGLMSHASANAPVIPDLPGYKLFIGEGMTPAFDLIAYDTTAETDSVNDASIVTNFLGASSISSTLSGTTVTSANVNYAVYGAATSGPNTYELSNAGGPGDGSNKVKWSTYKESKFGPQVMRAGDVITVSPKATNSGGSAIPESYGNSEAIVVSDTTQISAVWSGTDVVITALAGFNSAQSVDVIASPIATGAIGEDQDMESIAIYPAINSTAFDFDSAGDETVLTPQIPAGASTLSGISRVATINDGAGNASIGGALKIANAATTDGVKLTPAFSAWLPNVFGDWYTLRLRVFGDNPANTFLGVMFNGVAASTPTDIQGYFRYSVPTTWTNLDIPINSASIVSTGNAMYPQIIVQAGAIGNVYVDSARIFQGPPSLIAARAATSDSYAGGKFNGAVASYYSVATNAPNFTANIVNGALQFTPTGNAAGKFTASTSAGASYTVAANAGTQFGAHMQTSETGTPSLINTLAQVNVLGVTAPGSLVQGGDIGAAAEVGRVSSRTLRTAFNAANANYLVQFLLKGQNGEVITVDNVQADKDNDAPNFGDSTLFP